MPLRLAPSLCPLSVLLLPALLPAPSNADNLVHPQLALDLLQGSRRAVIALQGMGLDVWVVTGDNRRVAAALARRLGIPADRVMAEVLPAEKARKVGLSVCALRG